MAVRQPGTVQFFYTLEKDCRCIAGSALQVGIRWIDANVWPSKWKKEVGCFRWNWRSIKYIGIRMLRVQQPATALAATPTGPKASSHG